VVAMASNPTAALPALATISLLEMAGGAFRLAG